MLSEAAIIERAGEQLLSAAAPPRIKKARPTFSISAEALRAVAPWSVACEFFFLLRKESRAEIGYTALNIKTARHPVKLSETLRPRFVPGGESPAMSPPACHGHDWEQ